MYRRGLSRSFLEKLTLYPKGEDRPRLTTCGGRLGCFRLLMEEAARRPADALRLSRVELVRTFLEELTFRSLQPARGFPQKHTLRPSAASAWLPVEAHLRAINWRCTAGTLHLRHPAVAVTHQPLARDADHRFWERRRCHSWPTAGQASNADASNRPNGVLKLVHRVEVSAHRKD